MPDGREAQRRLRELIGLALAHDDHELAVSLQGYITRALRHHCDFRSPELFDFLRSELPRLRSLLGDRWSAQDFDAHQRWATYCDQEG